VLPGEDLQKLVDAAPAGQAFRLAAGTYRLQQVTPKDGNVFYGEPGAVLNGSSVLSEFSREGSVWVGSGVTQEKGQATGYCARGYSACIYPEDLFIDNTLLRRVNSRAEVKAGRWYFDYGNHRVILGDDPNGHKVELGQSRFAFGGKASNVTVRGFVIEKYAAPSQHGAIDVTGSGWTVEENEVRFVHGAGISGSASAKISRNVVHHNGQQGLHLGGGSDILIDGNTIAFNNTAGFDSGWEAGGAKFANTDGLTVRGNIVIANKGPGLWTDVDNNNTVYEHNRIENNDGPGIFHEISYKAVISNNMIGGNGLVSDLWLWGGQIVISNSPDVEIHHNDVTVAANGGDGITVIQSSDRGTGKYGPHVTRNANVHSNTIRYMGKVGLSGAAADTNPAAFFAGNNRLDYNTYIVPDVMGAFWEWHGPVDWDGMRAAGQEAYGVVKTP
jgi:parallel beta-helix repeat protein